MLEIVKDINDFGLFSTVVGFLLALSALMGIKAGIKKVKDVLGLVDVRELEKQDMLSRIAKLEQDVKKVDQRVTDTSNMYNDKLDGFHQQSIDIRGNLADNIASVKGAQDDIKASLLDLKNLVIDDKIDTIRWEILDFSSRLATSPDAKFNKEQFDHIFELETKYEKILEDFGLENGKFTVSMNFIKKKYAEFMENGFN